MAVVSELVALLSLRTDQASFSKGEAAVEGLLGTLEKAVGADLLGRLAGGFHAIAQEAGALADNAEILGISTQQLQSLGYATARSGMSMQELVGSLSVLSRMSGTAGNEHLAEVFAKLHVSTRGANGEMKTTGELLPEIADGFQGIKSHAEQVAVAQALFGRGSRALVPILAQGREGLASLNAEFEALGGGFSPELIEAADKLDDALLALRTSGQSWYSILTPIVQQTTQWSTALARASRSAQGTLEGTQVLGVALATTTALALAQGVAMVFASDKARALGKTAIAVGVFAAAWDDVRAGILGANSVLGTFVDKMAGVGKWNEYVKNLGASLQAMFGGGDLLASLKGDPASRARELNKQAAALQAKMQTPYKDAYHTPYSDQEKADMQREYQRLLRARDYNEGLAREFAKGDRQVATGRGTGADVEAVLAGRASASAVSSVLAAPGASSVLGVSGKVAMQGKDGGTVIVNAPLTVNEAKDGKNTAEKVKAHLDNVGRQIKQTRASRVTGGPE